MKLRIARTDCYFGYEAVAALTAVLILDREDRIVSCILAALLHECGHLLLMFLCGVRVRCVRVRLFDVLIEAREAPSAFLDALITLGGPSANLLFAAAFLPFGIKWWLPNLALGVFNLLPLLSLDGGYLLALLLRRRCSPRTVMSILRISTFLFIVPLMTAGILLLFRSGHNYSLLVISLYLTALLFLKS